jgi:type II secretory pathway pseudopilin PulG
VKTEPFTKPSGRLSRRQPLRSAITLVEVCVVMALSAVLLGMAVALLAGLLRWDYRFRDQGVRAEQLALLSETMRSDIRDATDVTLAAKETLVVTGADQRTTRYELTPAGCERTVKLGDDANLQRELFGIGTSVHWNLEAASGGATPTMFVMLERSDRENNFTQLLLAASRGANLLNEPSTPRADSSKPDEPGEKP